MTENYARDGTPLNLDALKAAHQKALLRWNSAQSSKDPKAIATAKAAADDAGRKWAEAARKKAQPGSGSALDLLGGGR